MSAGKNENQPPEIAPQVTILLLVQRFLDRGLSPSILLVLAILYLGDALDFLKTLFEGGPAHFWAFVGLLVTLALTAFLARRRNDTLREQAQRNRDLMAAHEALMLDNHRLRRELERSRRRALLEHPPPADTEDEP